MSLETLSNRSVVSTSMLSTVERGQKVPTILVLSQIATALDTSVGRLADGEDSAPRVVVLRAADQRVINDPAGVERRTLSPMLPAAAFEMMRTTLAAGADAGTFPAHRAGSAEYLAVESGSLTLTLADSVYVLEAGDAIYYDGDCVHGYRNDGDAPCTYYLAMDIAAG